MGALLTTNPSASESEKASTSLPLQHQEPDFIKNELPSAELTHNVSLAPDSVARTKSGATPTSINVAGAVVASAGTVLFVDQTVGYGAKSDGLSSLGIVGLPLTGTGILLISYK